MRKTVACLMISLLCFQGCTFDKPLAKRKLESIPYLIIAHDKTPRLRRLTLTSDYVSAISSSDPTGLVKLAADSTLWPSGKRYEQVDVPDFGKLVTDKFVEQINEEIYDWPVAMKVVEESITKEANDILKFTFPVFGIHCKYGFTSTSRVTLVRYNGKILWQKEFTYRKKEAYVSEKEYEADNYRLLKDEMRFAAKKTVQCFIEHLKESQ